MKKGINILIVLGTVISLIGVVFGVKVKFFDNTIKASTNGNSTSYAGNKMLKIKKGATGRFNLELNIEEKGFYFIEFTLPDEIELYSDKSLTKKVERIYNEYTNSKEKITIYYKNNGNDFHGNPGINVKKGKQKNSMINKSSEKEFFWSDTYRPLIENIVFEYNENPSCEDMCFDLSNSITRVYANLIEKEGKYDLKIVSDYMIYLPEDSSYMFDSFDSLKTIKFNNVNTKYVKNMEYMFSNNKNIENIDLSSFDTSNVINMIGLFRNDEKLKSIDLSNFTFNDNLEFDYIFKNIDSESKVYVKSAFEQAWIFSLNIYIRPGIWTINNIIIK